MLLDAIAILPVGVLKVKDLTIAPVLVSTVLKIAQL